MVISLFCFTHWKETTHDCCPTAANSLWGPLPEPPAQGPLMPLIPLWCQHGHPQHTAPPPTTTLAARGNSCIREEPKQQFSSVLSKQLNHTPITQIPPILCQQEKRKAREKRIAQHHTWNVCLWFWESSGGASVAASIKQYFCLLTRMTSCSTYFVLKNIFYPEKQNVCG